MLWHKWVNDVVTLGTYFLGLTNSYCMTGQYEEAIMAGKRAATYSLSGREEETRTEAFEVLKINSNFSVEYWAKTMPFKNQADLDLVIGALRKAGLK